MSVRPACITGTGSAGASSRSGSAGFPVIRVVPIAPWLRERFGYAHSYNPRAYSIFAEREPVADV